MFAFKILNARTISSRLIAVLGVLSAGLIVLLAGGHRAPTTLPTLIPSWGLTIISCALFALWGNMLYELFSLRSISSTPRLTAVFSLICFMLWQVLFYRYHRFFLCILFCLLLLTLSFFLAKTVIPKQRFILLPLFIFSLSFVYMLYLSVGSLVLS